MNPEVGEQHKIIQRAHKGPPMRIWVQCSCGWEYEAHSTAIDQIVQQHFGQGGSA